MHVNAIEVDYKRALFGAVLGRNFFCPSSNNLYAEQRIPIQR